MSVEQRSLEEVVLAYIEAWNTPDEETQRTLLDRCWADDATYIDPASEVRGKDALVAHIGGFLRGERYGLGAGCRIPISSGVEHHHGMISFTWVLLNPEGVPVSRGLDFGELAADGRLQRITGFFGPPPPIPDDWPDHLVWHGD
jgi:SnoaL-like domain